MSRHIHVETSLSSLTDIVKSNQAGQVMTGSNKNAFLIDENNNNNNDNNNDHSNNNDNDNDNDNDNIEKDEDKDRAIAAPT